MQKGMLPTLLRRAFGLLVIVALAGCSSSDISSSDVKSIVPTAREFTADVVNTAMTRVTGKMEQIGGAWRLPTPTALPANLHIPFFDKQETGQSGAAVETGYWWVVTMDVLNVRAAPGSDQPTIATLAAGDCVQSDGHEQGWLKFSLPDRREGWLTGENVQLAQGCASGRIRSAWDGEPAADASAEQPVVTGKGMVVVPQLNVRSDPGTDAGVISTLAAYTCVDLLGDEGEWYQVALPSSGQGWSYASYIQPVEDCTEATALQATAAAMPVAAAAATPTPPLTPAAGPPAAPVIPNATVLTSSRLHECFGEGWSALRDVRGGTPVQVLGTGPFWPPPEEQADLGTGPFLKIRLWDGQAAWIPAEAVGFDLTTAATLSGQCEESDRINWDNVVRPTATLMPRATSPSSQGGWVRATPGVYSRAKMRTPTPTPTEEDDDRERDE